MSEANSSSSTAKPKILSSGLVKPRKVVFEKTFAPGITLREFDGIDCDGAVVLEGFPAVSLTPIICANYIADQLQLPQIGDLTSPDFPPRSVVTDGQPGAAARILGNRNVVVFLCEFGLGKGDMVQAVISAIMDFARRHKCSQVFTIEGVSKSSVERALLERDKTNEAKSTDKPKPTKEDRKDARRPSFADEDQDGPMLTPEERSRLGDRASKTVLYLTNAPSIDKTLFSQGHIPFSDGVVDGITGGILCEMPFLQSLEDAAAAPPPAAGAAPAVAGVNVTCMLASADMRFPDAASAVTVIKCIAVLAPQLSIDLKPLEEKARSIEKQVAKLTQRAGGGPRGAAPQSMYM